MDAAYPEVPVKMMNDFHAIDRQLYSILVFELQRDPKVSVYMVALWIWLEYNKIKNVVQKIVLLPIKSIDGLADEAVACLRCITDAMSSDATEILLTQNLIGKHLSLKFFHENRAKALCGIRMVVENVCVKVLEDLMKMANAERQLPSSVSEQQQVLKSQLVIKPPCLAVPPRLGRLRVTGESTQMVMMPPTVAEPMDSIILGGLIHTGESSRSVVPPIDHMIQKFEGLNFKGESSQSVVLPIDPMIQRVGGYRVTGESSQSMVRPIDPMIKSVGGLRVTGESTQMVMMPPTVAEPMDSIILGGLIHTGESSRSVVPPIDHMIQKFEGLNFKGESSQSVVLPIDPMIQRVGGHRVTGESSQSMVRPIDPMIESVGGLRVTGESSLPLVGMKEPKDKRKMFATFSNRNPVSKPELLGYFKKEFGEDIVESISMQVVKPNEKSLFAVIIFTSSAIVDLILKVDKGQIGCSLVSVVLIFPFLLRTD
nr:uncharacterized protein LOC109192891 [Ipomoea trifida]